MNSIHDLLDVVRAVVLTLVDLACIDQCVSGSAILLRTLHRTGFDKAYTMCVGVKIWNPAKPDRGVVLGKGATPQPGKWPGHLVVIVPSYSGDDHLMIDLTVVQVNEFVPGVSVDPFIGLVDDAFVKGSRPQLAEANGCQFEYEAFPSDVSYVKETNWSRIPRLDGAVAQAIDHLSSRGPCLNRTTASMAVAMDLYHDQVELPRATTPT